MIGPKRVLILYYSFTHQTERVLERISAELTTSGHRVDMRRITPAEDWKLPLRRTTFFWNWAKVWVGMNLTQPLEPMDLRGDDYDYILLGFQPWNLAPSIPVNSFLDSLMAEVFRGKKVIGIVTCRGRWERSFKITQEKIEKRGGEMIDGLVIMNQEREPYNMITTVYYLFNAQDPPPGHPFARYFRPFGIGDASLEIATDYGRDLAHRLTEDRLPNRKGWRVVNKPLSLV